MRHDCECCPFNPQQELCHRQQAACPLHQHYLKSIQYPLDVPMQQLIGYQAGSLEIAAGNQILPKQKIKAKAQADNVECKDVIITGAG